MAGWATLADGAVLRPAAPADAEQVCVLLADRGEAADAVDLRSVVGDQDAGWDGVGVVVADGRVVATATLLEEQVRVGVTTLPAGQIELVATDRAYEHRGYVRALMGWCHQRSASLGHRVQLMIGIPYFYRRFGYVYAVPMYPYAPLVAPPPVPDGVTARRGTAADVEAMRRLQDDVQASVDVAMQHSAACWRWLVDREGSAQWVAERGGEVVATARVTDVEDGVVRAGEVAGTDADGVRALLAAAAGQHGARDVQVADRPGVPGLAGLLGEPVRREWYYARIPDWVELLEALRPELDRRLAASPFAAAEGELLLSSWSSHVRIPYAGGRLSRVRSGGPMQTPVSSGGSGVPPDALPHLVLGCGAAGLEDGFPDAHLGRQRELVAALFPPQRADLLTFYLP